MKYVALLAFNKIVATHPFLVAQQEDAILECIDSADITIRIKSLDLVQGMVSSDNLVSIVSRLMRQLKSSATAAPQKPAVAHPLEFKAESDEEAEPKPPVNSNNHSPPLPEAYKVDVIDRILTMCSQNNYSNLVDFDWYIDVLTQLVRMAPHPRQFGDLELSRSSKSNAEDVSERIGSELRNVAVKVKAVRPSAVRAAELAVQQLSAESPTAHPVTSKALNSISWVVGEYASQLSSCDDTLGCLLQLLSKTTFPEVLTACLQSVIKIFAFMSGDDLTLWSPERKSRISLLIARIIHAVEPLALHPNLEVQESAVGFSELLKLASEAVSGQPASTSDNQQDPPLLLTQAIPALFHGWELNSVAAGAQQNVPLPDGLDLDEPIHPNLSNLLAEGNLLSIPEGADDEFEVYYYRKPPAASVSSTEPAINKLQEAPEEGPVSYQQAEEESYLDPDIIARRKAELVERNRDDPFYIQDRSHMAGTSTPIHDILQNENGQELDIDSIPIMQLDLNKLNSPLSSSLPSAHSPIRSKPRQRVIVAADETLTGSGLSTPNNYESENNSDSFTKSRSKKLKHSLLQVDSSHIGALSLDDNQASDSYDFERQKHAEAEMAQALKEVEKRRLEMQRANERIEVADGVPIEGTVVRKKKAKKPKPEGEAAGVKVKKKKKPVVTEDSDAGGGVEAVTVSDSTVAVVKPKKKKPKPPVDLQEPGPA